MLRNQTAGCQETYRPRYHFTPQAHWMNDPNGMVFFEGEYHLFYQHNPEGTTWGPMYWGHAVSKDLVRWEHYPIALKPDRHGAIFSGSAVVDWEDTSGFFLGRPGLVAVFTHSDQYPESDRVRQRQSLAYSLDQGRTWTVYDGNPVLCNEQVTDFRDPKVFWYAPDRQWIMVLAAGDRVQFYTSPDLKKWSFASEFGAADGSHDGVWECPDLVELPVEGREDTKWVLIVSIGDHPGLAEGSRTQYFIGSFDGRKFVNDSSPETVLWLDHGRDNYAAVTWSDTGRPDHGKVLIGWMNNWKYANLIPAGEWRGAMTLPRVLLLREGASGIRLVQKPVEKLQELRLEGRYWENEAVQPGTNLLAGIRGIAYEIECELEWSDGVTEIGFKLRTSDREETVVGCDMVKRRLFVDRSRSGESGFHSAFACRHDAPLETPGSRLQLKLFVDSTSVEVFANGGELTVTDQIFPAPSSAGMELYVQGGETTVRTLRYYPLNLGSTEGTEC